MKTLNKISFVVFLSILCLQSNAQEAKYTQGFYSNPLKLNPAYMGMNNDLKFIANYRTQWSGVGNGYTTGSFTTLFPLFVKGNNRKIDLGLNIVNDQAGAFNNLDAGLAIGYRLKTSNSGYVSFSVLGDYIQKTLDVGTLTFDDQYVLGNYSASNPTNAVIANNKISFFDLNAGLMWYFNEKDSKLNGYFGVSGYHLNSINETYINGNGNLPTLYSVQVGVKIKGDDAKLDFTPNVRYFNQANSQIFAIGTYVDYHVSDKASIKLGGWYKTNNAYAAMLGLNISKFSLAYSYDIINQSMSNYIAGLNAHEITLSFSIDQAAKKGVDSAPSIY